MNTDQMRESRAIVTGLGLVCLALFMGVSLYTHSPYDVLDYHAAQSQEMQNKAGLIGAQLAHHAFCLYGTGAWVLTVLMLLCGSWMCAMRSMSGVVAKAIGTVLLTALVCTWAAAMEPLHLAAAGADGDYPAGPGGLLGGTLLAPPLISYFGRLGVFLVLAATALLCCLLLAPGLTEFLLGLVGRGVVLAGQWLADLLLGRPRQTASPFVPARPVLAAANAGGAAGADGLGGHENAFARVDIVPGQATRRMRPPLTDSDEEADEALSDRARRLKAAQKKDDESGEETPPRGRRFEADDRLKAEKRAARAEAEQATEEQEAEQRRLEAVRQAEAAEATRLEREKQAHDEYARQAKALEKLDKERAAQEEKRARQQEKFAAAMAAAAGANAPAQGEDAAADAAPAKPKPQLPARYDLPRYDLLLEKDITPDITSETLKQRGATVIQTLWDFKIAANLVDIHKGPTVTMYELELAPGVKVQRVASLQDNLAIAMKADNGVRVVYPIPGRSTIGIEIPNVEEHTVRMRPILESPQFRAKTWKLPLVLGRDAVGHPLVADLADMPHLLIAGTTGSGKSVCVNSIILSTMILRRPHEVKLILVDPKQVEMTDFKGIPHLLSPVVTDMKLAAGVLTWAVQKMEERFERMAKLGVRNIGTFNRMSTEERLAKLPPDTPQEDFMEPLPHIIVVVDEFADLMMVAGKEIETAVQRLAQKARAAGIHVILATQRPSADVVTGIIKANFPCRICFQVKSKIDSRIVLEQGGGEKLAGRGDMLYIGPGNSNMIRAKGVYIADEEIRSVVGFCKNQAEPVYSDEIERVAAQVAQSGEGAEGADENNRQAIEMDEKFDEGVEVFLLCGRASTSLLQRRMGLGYTRAAKLCDQMEARGIVGPDRGAKGRELIITQEQWDEFKRIRANSNGSAWGPKGSKDNPNTDGAAASAAAAVAATAVAEEPAGEQPDPALLAQLSPIDGVKDPDDDEDEDA